MSLSELAAQAVAERLNPADSFEAQRLRSEAEIFSSFSKEVFVVPALFDVEQTRLAFETEVIKGLLPLGISEEELREEYLQRNPHDHNGYLDVLVEGEWGGWKRGVMHGYELWGDEVTLTEAIEVSREAFEIAVAKRYWKKLQSEIYHYRHIPFEKSVVALRSWMTWDDKQKFYCPSLTSTHLKNLQNEWETWKTAFEAGWEAR